MSPSTSCCRIFSRSGRNSSRREPPYDHGDGAGVSPPGRRSLLSRQEGARAGVLLHRGGHVRSRPLHRWRSLHGEPQRRRSPAHPGQPRLHGIGSALLRRRSDGDPWRRHVDHVRAWHGIHHHRVTDESSPRSRLVRHFGGSKGMSLLRNHIVLMFIYAVATSLFFALLWKTTRHERLRFFFLVFCALFIGGSALGWVMYPFPLR